MYWCDDIHVHIRLILSLIKLSQHVLVDDMYFHIHLIL